ncbi:MAG: helix-turn-helix domain-containing protein [Clostridiales bacterium]|nr:helix-turn-helix domain-containing protein [Clostridiales bacterium]
MTSSQNGQVLRFMEQHGSITALEAMREIGCYRLAARISDLRRAGNNIVSESFTVVKPDGTKTRVARYRLA